MNGCQKNGPTVSEIVVINIDENDRNKLIAVCWTNFTSALIALLMIARFRRFRECWLAKIGKNLPTYKCGVEYLDGY